MEGRKTGEGGQTGEGRRTGRGEGLRGETDREGEQTGRGGGQTGRGDIHRGRHSLLLVGGGLIHHSSTGGCPSSFVVIVRHGHHCPCVGHHCLGGHSFCIVFHSVIICGHQVVVCVWCPSFLGVLWVVVVIGGFLHAVCHSWVPGSLCKWVLGLVCGHRRPLVGCQLESHIDMACSGATSVVWCWHHGDW